MHDGTQSRMGLKAALQMCSIDRRQELVLCNGHKKKNMGHCVTMTFPVTTNTFTLQCNVMIDLMFHHSGEKYTNMIPILLIEDMEYRLSQATVTRPRMQLDRML